MNDVFVIQNQLGHFWGKKKLWVDGSDGRLVLRVKHRDEAVNTLFELSSKDIELRGEICAANVSDRGEPILEVSDIALPQILEDQSLSENKEVVEAAQD
jgi:hypothetical protein